MYPLIVLAFMLVLPAGSIAIDAATAAGPIVLMALIGKWFVFWSVGMRLLTAGLRQYFQPRFTAEQIFETTSPEVLPLVRELGIANAAAGVVGVASLWMPGFALPSAISAAIFYGVAGFRHTLESGRSRNENIAMVSDIFIFAVLAAYAVWALMR